MTLPETIWAHAMHEALMEGRELCAMPRYLWKHAPDVSMRLEPGGMRGFDLERDLPHDPDGLDDVDPEIYRMLNPSRLPNVMVLGKNGARAMNPNKGLKAGEVIMLVGVPRPDSSSWARELFMREGVVWTESPPCEIWADNVDAASEMKNAILDRARILAALTELNAMTLPDEIILTDDTHEMMSRLLAPHQLGGRLTEDELYSVFVPRDPPSGKRYGPYDADPHTKGRRKRFRPQRRS